MRYKRRCITEVECTRKRGMFPHDGKCHQDCPAGYERDPSYEQQNPQGKVMCKKCVTGTCPKSTNDHNVSVERFVLSECSSKSVTSAAELVQVQGCNIIEGFLDIDMQTRSISHTVDKLTAALSEIRVRCGRFRYLQCIKSRFRRYTITCASPTWSKRTVSPFLAI